MSDGPPHSSASVQAYDVSADGHKLVYRAATAAGAVDEGRGGAARLKTRLSPVLYLVDTKIALAPQPEPSRLNATLHMYLDPKEEFKQIFYEGWRNQRDYLYVPNLHGADWPRMKEVYDQLFAVR